MKQSSSGGAGCPAASALFKPDVQISRIRLTRILSVPGMHSEPTLRRLQELQAKALQMGVKRLPFRGPEGALTPTLQVTRQTKQHESVQLAETFPGIAVTEVSAPALHPAVDFTDHHGDGDETPMGTGQLPNLLTSSSHCLRRRKHVEIAMFAAEAVAVVPQRKPQEVQAFPRLVQLDDPRLLAVNGQPKSALQQSLDPVDQLPGLIACQNHKVIRVSHQLGIGPSARTIRAVELLLEPVQVQIG